MFSTVLSATVHGLCVEFVHVEADTSNGLPVFHMVGYLSSEVKEAGERVRTAIRNSGFLLPAKKIVINLSPANIRKRGTMFDLPIAISILASLEQVRLADFESALFVGELSLDGAVKSVPGILPIVLEAKEKGYQVCVVPKENEKEGALIDGIQIIGVSTLKEVCQILNGEKRIEQSKELDQNTWMTLCKKNELDYCDIKGQRAAKRAAEIAVAGNHNMLLLGPPGAGKSMIAKCIPSILPTLTLEESMELTKLYSIVGELNRNAPLVTVRPFREVHHSITKAALIGGGRIPRPGEISLSHKGVLFLDEIAEFQKPVLELLRQPLEDHKIKIIREGREYEFPAEFLLIAAMNPCSCGYYPDLNKCTCTPSQIQSYSGRVSQPLLDRIDICVEVERVKYEELNMEREEESSVPIRERVLQARKIQEKRYQKIGIYTNSQLRAKDIPEYCALGEKEERLMRQAFEYFGLTVRKYHKVLGVSRTIADLEGKENIEAHHLREALSYRTPEKNYWGGKRI